ncbi:hypothetical protein GCM10017752_11450 [Streptomyces roseoviridis]
MRGTGTLAAANVTIQNASVASAHRFCPTLRLVTDDVRDASRLRCQRFGHASRSQPAAPAPF